MALDNLVDGSDIVLKIETSTPGVFVEMYGSNSYARNSSRTSNAQSVFMLSQQVKSIGQIAENYTIGGLIDASDPGFIRLTEMYAAKETANIQFLYDGVNGFEQPVVITAFNTTIDPDNVATFDITFEADGEAVVVGAGPVF